MLNEHKWGVKQTGYLVYLIREEGLTRRESASRINEVFGTSFSKNCIIGKYYRLVRDPNADLDFLQIMGQLVQLCVLGDVEFLEDNSVRLTEQGRVIAKKLRVNK